MNTTYHTKFRGILWRAALFVALFALLSGIIGPPIIRSGILYAGHFDIYATGGKIALFMLVALGVILARRQVPALQPWNRIATLCLTAGILSAAITIACTMLMLSHADMPTLYIATHAGLLASVCLLVAGSFGPGNIALLSKTFRQELLAAGGMGLAFYVFLIIVYGAWRYLSLSVLHVVRILLEACGLHTEILPPFTLIFDKFGVEIAQYCSGIESIALFTGLYILIGLLDWHKLSHRKYILLFPLALLGLFTFNILRVYGIILAAYYTNPTIAFELFHTYAGLVFFILYSGLFWKLCYSYMLRPRTPTAYNTTHAG